MSTRVLVIAKMNGNGHDSHEPFPSAKDPVDEFEGGGGGVAAGSHDTNDLIF